MRNVKYGLIFVFFLLLYLRGTACRTTPRTIPPPFHKNVPTLQDDDESTTFTSIASINSQMHNNFKEHCLSINNINTITCLCDAPHTVRCRGLVLSPQDFQKLTVKLKERDELAFNVSLLDLSITYLSTLPSKVFDGLNLMGLIISGADSINLSSTSFAGLESKLIALGLPFNKLQKIPRVALEILENLKRLDLSDNKIRILRYSDFPELQTLEDLNLSGNGIISIDSDSFSHFSGLKFLNLGRNLLITSLISNETFQGLKRLEKLSLSSNKLKGPLGPRLAPNLLSLQFLDLSHNSFTSIAKSALKNCNSLVNLDLSYNLIDIIEDHAFQHLSKLQHLDLSHNNIISFSGWSLAYLPNLTNLNLADNALFAITTDLVHQLPKLQVLDLASNDISLIQEQVFNYTPVLSNVDLRDNPLHCDCSIKWFRQWLLKKFSKNGKDESNSICVTPQNLENVYLIELEESELRCTKGTTDYNYSDVIEDEDDAYIEKSNPEKIQLQAANWVNDDEVQLVWHISEQVATYTCQGVHIYEIEKIRTSPRQILTEKLKVNCSSQVLSDPHHIVINIPSTVVQIGRLYRYCLVLIEKSITKDDENFLTGCSEPLLLNDPNIKSPEKEEEAKITSLTAGITGMSLVVQTRLNTYTAPCSYHVYIISKNLIKTYIQLNCSNSRHTFTSMDTGFYTVCATTEEQKSYFTKLNDLENNLLKSSNTSETLSGFFPVCTTVELREAPTSGRIVEPLIILLFTLPGLALLLTLYILSRRVLKVGGRIIFWRWDSRTSKRTKYFLYIGEASTPSTSLDSIPEPESSV